jgi:signal transduction histidine kinase
MAVREQLHQVILNLVLNAKQAIGEKGEISIGIGESNGFVVVNVSDTGSGIPDSRLESLFRPLQSRKPGGLGVGLYQSKQIVEAHQGTILVQSQEGVGTQVRIELPIYHAPATI